MLSRFPGTLTNTKANRLGPQRKHDERYSYDNDTTPVPILPPDLSLNNENLTGDWPISASSARSRATSITADPPAESPAAKIGHASFVKSSRPRTPDEPASSSIAKPTRASNAPSCAWAVFDITLKKGNKLARMSSTDPYPAHFLGSMPCRLRLRALGEKDVAAWICGLPIPGTGNEGKAMGYGLAPQVPQYHQVPNNQKKPQDIAINQRKMWRSLAMDREKQNVNCVVLGKVEWGLLIGSLVILMEDEVVGIGMEIEEVEDRPASYSGQSW